MIFGAYDKVIYSNPATTAATNATTTARCDTLGFRYALFEAVIPPAVATNSSAKFTSLSIYEADTTIYATTNAVLLGTTNATAAAGSYVLPAWNDTSNPQIVRLGIDLRGRKRYLFALIDLPDVTNYTTFVYSWRLSRAEEEPNTTTEAGVSAWAFA